MKLKTPMLFFWVVLIAGAAIAGEERQTRIEIVVEDDTTGGQSFLFDSEDAGFDLHSLAVGETRTLTDRHGSSADIRRTDDGFQFDVNGKTIDLMSPPHDEKHGSHMLELLVDNADSDVVVIKDARNVEVIESDTADSVTVISSGEIDSATRERIREALQASGMNNEVRFIDSSELSVDANSKLHGDHGVRIIKRETTVTN